MKISRMWWMLGVPLALAACGRGENNAAVNEVGDTMGMATTPMSAAADTARFSDAQVAAVLSASDSAEIKPSQLALQKAQNPQLKEFAQRMLTDHGMLEDSLHAMLTQMNMTPAPSTLSTQVQAQSSSTMQELQGLSGAAFDQAYARAMLQSHEAALNAIDSRLLPSIQSPQLKTAVQKKVRPTVEAHLKRIKEIEKAMGWQG